MRRLLALFLATGVIVHSSITATHAQDVVVSGTVKTTQGIPVQGYPIILSNDEQQVVAVTDKMGNFFASGLQPGNYTAMIATSVNNDLDFTVPHVDQSWYQRIFNPRQETVNIGEFELIPMEELNSSSNSFDSAITEAVE